MKNIAPARVLYLTRHRIGYTYSHSKNYATARAARAAAMIYCHYGRATRAAVIITAGGETANVNTAPQT